MDKYYRWARHNFRSLANRDWERLEGIVHEAYWGSGLLATILYLAILFSALTLGNKAVAALSLDDPFGLLPAALVLLGIWAFRRCLKKLQDRAVCKFIRDRASGT